jgi:SnoaL-like domain
VDRAVQETLDYIAVRRLQDAYADLAGRRAWSELAEIVLADAPISLDTRTQPALRFVGPQAVAEFLAPIVDRYAFFQFAILNTRVLVPHGGDGDAALARMTICEHRCDTGAGDGTGEWTRAFGVYHDHCRRVDGRWWIAARRYHSLAREPESAVFAFPEDGSS